MITDEAVSEFVSLTNASPDEARGYLEMAGGELQSAVNLFLEMGGPPPAAAAPTQPPTAAKGGPSFGAGVVDPDVAAEVAAAAAAAGIDADQLDAPMGAAEEVRAPMAAFEDQMINPDAERRREQEAIAADSRAMEMRMNFDRSGRGSDAPGPNAAAQDVEMGSGEEINKLFAAPSYNETQPFLKAVEKAKAEEKWLLVNVQQAEVFASHQLNRDVWSDETVKDIVEGSFVFWQRDDKSNDGSNFCMYYKCGHQLPHICVVDPRTGRRVKGWDGRKWVESHAAAEYLIGFLDENNYSKTPIAGSPAASPVLQPQAAPEPPGAVELTGLDEAMPDAPANGEPKEPVAALPEEPPEGSDCVKTSMKLPSGQRVTRRFLADAPLEQMFAAASALAEQPMSLIDLSTQFPKRSLRELEGGLECKMRDAQVANNMILVNVRKPS